MVVSVLGVRARCDRECLGMRARCGRECLGVKTRGGLSVWV